MKDYIVALGCLALSLFVYISSQSFADSGKGLDQDPAYYPTLLVGLLVFMSVILLVNTIRNKEKIVGKGQKTQYRTSTREERMSVNVARKK